LRPVFTVSVEPDECTAAASTAFDYAFTGISTFEGWEKPEIPTDFGIGLIVGPSGSGKSLLLKQFGEEVTPEWNPNKAIVSQFKTPEDSLEWMMAVGLNSIPSWCRPYHVLSNGEQFRANLARRLDNDTIIDEFTSVVDRNVAKAVSCSLRRYVDRKGLKGLVLASCHHDILEWLRPDWYFDTTDGILHDGRLLRRPPIEIRIYPCKRSAWGMFAKHHYLSGSLNPSCRSYLATANFGSGEETVGFASSISFPSGHFKNAYREHRTVVLPDFQGLGLGPRISDVVAQIHIDLGKRYFSRTAHPRFGAYRDASPLWKKTSKYKKVRDDVAAGKKRGDGTYNFHSYNFNDKRNCFSHEYIGNRTPDWTDEIGVST
jgi:GNAT superfamily N-acetyltransferase